MSIDGTGAGRRRLGQALRELRHAADLTTTQLAERLGVAQSTISRWESGRQLLTPAQVDQWAAAPGATHPNKLGPSMIPATISPITCGW